MGLIRCDYGTIATRLHEFEKYLSGLGLRRGPDRLHRLIERVEQCEEARNSGQMELLQQRSDVEDLVWSLVEGTEFVRIYEGLRGYDPEAVKRLTKTALGGPLHPSCEKLSSDSNKARNATFELRLGAGLRTQGVEVTLGSQADLIINLKDMRVFIECKRPFYTHTIRNNIEKARRQLQKRMNDDHHSCSVGIVAISVSKALNPGSNLFRVDQPNMLQNLSRDIISLHEQYSADYSRLVDLRLIGILYHLFTPAYIRDIQLLTAASQAVIFLHGPAMQVMFPVSGGDVLVSLLRNALQSAPTGTCP